MVVKISFEMVIKRVWSDILDIKRMDTVTRTVREMDSRQK